MQRKDLWLSFKNIENTSVNQPENIYKFITLFEEYSHLVSWQDLQYFDSFIMKLLQKAKLDNNEKAILASQEALLIVCKHPEYLFLKPDSELRNTKKTKKNYPLHFAAKNGYKEIFKLFYLHEDTQDFARKDAIQILREGKHQEYINEFSYFLAKSHYKTNIITFYMAVTAPDNQSIFNLDVIRLISKLLLDIGQQECILSFDKTNEPPLAFRRKMADQFSIFNNHPVSHDWIIARALVGIKNYQDVAHPESTGAKRAHWLGDFLEKEQVSSHCKILAIHSVLNEIDYSSLNFIFARKSPSIRQNYLKQAIGRYTKIIADTAQSLANEMDESLANLIDNITALINGNHCAKYHIENDEQFFSLIGASMPKKLNLKIT